MEPITIAEFIEEVSGRELNEWQKEFITKTYMFYKANPNGRLIARGIAKVFDMYEEKKK